MSIQRKQKALDQCTMHILVSDGNNTTNTQDGNAPSLDIVCFVVDSSCSESNVIENTVGTNINCDCSYSCYIIIVGNSNYKLCTMWNTMITRDASVIGIKWF